MVSTPSRLVGMLGRKTIWNNLTNCFVNAFLPLVFGTIVSGSTIISSAMFTDLWNCCLDNRRPGLSSDQNSASSDCPPVVDTGSPGRMAFSFSSQSGLKVNSVSGIWSRAGAAGAVVGPRRRGDRPLALSSFALEAMAGAVVGRSGRDRPLALRSFALEAMVSLLSRDRPLALSSPTPETVVVAVAVAVLGRWVTFIRLRLGARAVLARLSGGSVTSSR